MSENALQVIPEIPETPVVPQYPALGAADFSQQAWVVWTRMPSVTIRLGEIAAAVHGCAIAARDYSVIAKSAEAEASRQAGIAMGYSSVAEQAASTVARQAGEAATSASSAAQSEDFVRRMNLGAQSVLPALDGQGRPLLVGAQCLYTGSTPSKQMSWDGAQWLLGLNVSAGVTSVDGKEGALLVVDTSYPNATTAEMRAGTVSAPRSMSPAAIAAAVETLGVSKIGFVARSANTQLISTDTGKIFSLTGTFTQTFLAPAALGAGWWCYIKNAGAGDITIPSSDGRSNWIMYPGEMRLFQCDGSTLRSFVITPFFLKMTSSGNFVKPPGYREFEGLLWRGASSGGRGTVNSPGVGGQGGLCVPIKLLNSELADTVPVVIGAGGASINTDSTLGNLGGDSSFGPVIANTSNPAASLTVSYNGQGWSEYLGGISAGAVVHTKFGGGSGVHQSTLASAKTIFGGLGGQTLGADGQAPAGGGAANVGGPSGAGARGELQLWGVR